MLIATCNIIGTTVVLIATFNIIGTTVVRIAKIIGTTVVLIDTYVKHTKMNKKNVLIIYIHVLIYKNHVNIASLVVTHGPRSMFGTFIYIPVYI